MNIELELRKARTIEPLLTCMGIGLGCDEPLANYTQEALDIEFNQIRREAVLAICDPISNCKKVKKINTWSGSYGLKHTLENRLGEYVTNGELIVAMLICGFNHHRELIHKGCLSPNCCFNVSRESVKWLGSVRHSVVNGDKWPFPPRNV